MKKLKKILNISIILGIVLSISISSNLYAVSYNSGLKEAEYSEDYKKWLSLSNEEKQKTIMPRKYEIENTNIGIKSFNPLRRAMTEPDSLPTRYRLDTNGNINMQVKNQGNTAYCWAFGAVSVLETTLAKANPEKQSEYDYSERHMAYATTREFLDGTNDMGFNRQVGDGGAWWTAETYLTNGSGAKKETDMPFVNTQDKVQLSAIKQGDVATEIYDTIYFPNYRNEDKSLNINIINKIKEHIKNTGAVFAAIHSKTEDSECYNKDTGAIYCKSEEGHEINHAVSIIGWDDEYSANNFLSNEKPQAGAWIIKNSWGENMGENGYMYVSYEDANISKELYGIVKASDKVSYDNVYQYNKFMPNKQMETRSTFACMCNVFEKNQTGKAELLNQVSITIAEKCECKLYIKTNLPSNQNNIINNINSFEEVNLKNSSDGKSIILDPGYHKLELESPIEVDDGKFAVVIEMRSIDDQDINLAIEMSEIDAEKEQYSYEYVTGENGRCFYKTSSCNSEGVWKDLNTEIENSNSSIKAFTTIKKDEEISLVQIKVTNPPNKTTYYANENFEKSGMKVTAYYSNGTSKELQDNEYTIEGGNDLKLNQTRVTIKYGGKSTTQDITVKEKQLPDENSDEKPNKEKPDDGKQDNEKPIDEKQNNQNKDDDKETQKAQNSKLDNLSTDVKNIRAYYYTDNSNKDYTLIDMQVNGITKNLTNDKLEYYYYLSTSKNEKNINNWIKITDTQKYNDKLQFTINSKDIANYKELAKSNVLYMYIKEVATKAGDQSEVISNAMKIETNKDVEVYENNKKKEKNVNSTINNNDNNKNVNKEEKTNIKANEEKLKDTTTAKVKLPQTGAKITVVIAISIIVGVGIILFIRYRNLSKYVK